MKTATYQTLDGKTRTVEYDETAPIRIHWGPNYEPDSKTACGLLVRDVMETRDLFTNVASSVECDDCQKFFEGIRAGVADLRAGRITLWEDTPESKRKGEE